MYFDIFNTFYFDNLLIEIENQRILTYGQSGQTLKSDLVFEVIIFKQMTLINIIK